MDEATMHYIRSPEFGGTAYGAIDWKPEGASYRADVPVAGNLSAVDVILAIMFRPRRPAELTVLLRVEKLLWRIDHNQIHRRQPRNTHLQREQGHDFYEELDPAEVGSPPMGDDVLPHAIEIAFRKSAAFYNVDTGALDWVDPPGGE